MNRVTDEQYQRALEWLSTPWASSDDQKMMAIAILGRRGGPEALSALRKLLYTAQDSLSKTGELIPADFPRGGMVLRRVAATIAGLFGKQGLHVLSEMMKNTASSSVLCELAVAAVAGLFDRQAYQIITLGLQSKEPFVRRAAVEAAHLTASQFPSGVSTDFEAVLTELATLACNSEALPSEAEIVVDDGSQLARQVVGRYATPDLERQFIRILRFSADENRCSLAIEILSRRETKQARSAIVSCLRRKNKPPLVYERIAQSAACSDDISLRRAASSVIAEGPVVKVVQSTFGEHRRRSYHARRKASERILQGRIA